MGGERKRKREKREYDRRHYEAKKDRLIEKKREKRERYCMGREDVRVAAATLAPPSSLSASPSTSSFAPSHMEAQRISYLVPRYHVGDTLLLEANTRRRGYVFIFI